MALSATAEPGSTPPGVRLQVTGRGSLNTNLTIVRVTPTGTQQVRGVLRVTNGAGLTYDYEAPYGQAVSYRTVETSPEASGTVTLSPARAWLIHPFFLSLSTPVLGNKGDARAVPAAPVLGAGSFAEETLTSNSAALDVLNRDDPAVQRVGRKRGRTGTIVLKVYTQAQDEAVRQLVDDDQAVLFSVPPSLGWNVRSAWLLLGDLTRSRRTEAGARDQYATWSGEFRVTLPPFGRSLPTWSCGDVLDTYATCGDVEAMFRTCGDLEANMPVVVA